MCVISCMKIKEMYMKTASKLLFAAALGVFTLVACADSPKSDAEKTEIEKNAVIKPDEEHLLPECLVRDDITVWIEEGQLIVSFSESGRVILKIEKDGELQVLAEELEGCKKLPATIS